MFHSNISENRRSTRVLSRPGGASNMDGIFGSSSTTNNYEEPVQQKENYSQHVNHNIINPAPQEQQQMMKPKKQSNNSLFGSAGVSSSQQRVDSDIHSRPSTFVHQAPGGSSVAGSIIFGGGYDAQSEAPTRKAEAAPWENTQEQVHSGRKQFTNKGNETTMNQQMNQQQHNVSSKKQFSNMQQESNEQPQKLKPSTRVLQAPGGSSSFKLY